MSRRRRTTRCPGRCGSASSRPSGRSCLPRCCRCCGRPLPQLKLYLREDQTAPLLARLDAGTLDAAVLALPYPLDDMETRGYRARSVLGRLSAEPSPGALATVRPDDMAIEDLLLLEDGHCLRDHALTACQLEGARRNVAFQGTSLHTLVQMVANGLGVTLRAGDGARRRLSRGLDLYVAPLDGDRPCRRIALVWRKTSGRKETFRRLAETARAPSRQGRIGAGGPVGAVRPIGRFDRDAAAGLISRAEAWRSMEESSRWRCGLSTWRR